MIVSHQHRYVFVEVPHTGSTAVAAELCERYGGERVLRKHSTYAELHHSASRGERGYFLFAAVRDPLDATVTDYVKYATNHGGQYTDPDERDTAGGWVTKKHLERYRFVRDGADFAAYFRRYHRRVHHCPYLVSPRPFDLVMRTERLTADFAEALRRLGLTPSRDLPVVNKTSGKRDYASYYTPDLHEAAVRVFGPFLRRWGYDLPEAFGQRPVPVASLVEFEAIDAAATLISRLVPLGPHEPRVRRLRKALSSLAP